MKEKNRVQFKTYVPTFKRRLGDGLVRNLRAAMAVWERSIKLRLSNKEPRTGLSRFVPGTKSIYRSSAPGESPALATGVLRASYTQSVQPLQLKGQLGSPLGYAFELERGNSRIEPRPAIEPAYRDAEDEIKRQLSKEI